MKRLKEIIEAFLYKLRARKRLKELKKRDPFIY